MRETCVFVKPDRAPESPNIGRKWGPRPANYRRSASVRANRGISKSRGGERRKAVGRPRGAQFKVLLPNIIKCLPPKEPPRSIHDFWAGRKPSICCGVWAAPKTRETTHKNMGGDAPHICEWFPGPPVLPRPQKSMLSSRRPENHVLIKKRRQIDHPRGYGSPAGPSLEKATLQKRTSVSLSVAVRWRGRFPNSELLQRRGLT